MKDIQIGSFSSKKKQLRQEDEKYLPPGPKFFSVAQLLRPEESPVMGVPDLPEVHHLRVDLFEIWLSMANQPIPT